MQMSQQAERFQVREDVANGGAAYAQGAMRHKRARTDGCRRGDVFVDDGPQDRVGSRIQRADGAAWSSRHVRLHFPTGCERWFEWRPPRLSRREALRQAADPLFGLLLW